MNVRERLSILCSGQNCSFVLGILIFATALFWAKARDQFKRIDFSVKTASGTRVHGIAVLPKSRVPCASILYLHDTEDGLLGMGDHLRQFAEFGLAAIGTEYSDANQARYDEKLGALSQFVLRQRWSKASPTVWVGSSLDAQSGLSYVLNHPESRPQILVYLFGDWLNELSRSSPVRERKRVANNLSFDVQTLVLTLKLATNVGCKILLIHDDDRLIQTQEVESLARDLQINGSLRILKLSRRGSLYPGNDGALIFPLVAEACKSILAPEEPLVEMSRNHIKRHSGYIVPLLLLTTGVLWIKFRTRVEKTKNSRAPQTKLQRALHWLPWSLPIFVLGEIALRLVTPHLTVNQSTLALARGYLVPPQERNSFSYLSSNSIWRGERIHTLLEHVKLASYNRILINWKIEEDIYDRYVLSPEIDPLWRDYDWRRPLWENFYPRIRKEPDSVSAAQIVVDFLRQRVAVVSGDFSSSGIRNDWDTGMTDVAGFERIYAAALRSVGVAARLNVSGQVEIWAMHEWIAAPRPLTLE